MDPPLDGVSIAAFTLSFLALGIISIPLGIWGLVRTSGRRRRGRGFAVASFCIIGLWVAFSTVVAVIAIRSAAPTLESADAAQPVPAVTAAASAATPSAAAKSPRPPAAGQLTGPLKKKKRVYWDDLKVGNCINVPSDPDAIFVSVVDCRVAHQEEIFLHFDLPAGKWPGESVLDAKSDERCRPAFEKYVGISFDESALEYAPYYPTREAWQSGDRTVLCSLFASDSKELTRTLRGSRE